MRSDPRLNLFCADLAADLVEDAGKKYRPSNGDEGEMFMARYCDRCVDGQDGGCLIAGNAFFLDIDDPEYPAEWQYSDSGQPMCTAFKPAQEGGD